MERNNIKESLEKLEEHAADQYAQGRVWTEQHLQQLEEGVADLYQKLEDGVYNTYKALETGALRATDAVLDALLGKEDQDPKAKK